MKFEQLLKIYWSKGFYISNQFINYDLNIKNLKNSLYGLNQFLIDKLIRRFNLSYLVYDLKFTFDMLDLNKRKSINMYLAKILNVNFSINDLLKYQLIRFYLIKSYKGKSYSLKKPVRGQRTWSNASTPKKLNNKLSGFLTEMRVQYRKFLQTNDSKNKKFIKLKKRKKKFKFKKSKKKINIWF